MSLFGQKKRVSRRKVLSASGAGIAAAVIAGPAAAQTSAAFTAQEKSNMQVIDDFIAAWNAKDGTKVQSFFADDARFAVGEIGKTPSFTKPNFGGLIGGAKSVSMVITPGTRWARGPVVTHERTDNIVMGNDRVIAGKYIAVFTLRDGKIVDFVDFEFERPAQPPR
jgi:limonene-1,2-epoxide hydrolase